MAKSKHHPAQPSFPGIEPDLQRKLPLAKRESGANGKQKAIDAQNGPPNLAKPVKVRVPDFSQRKRPKTCLEVDFPIVPVNELSALEGNAGKPIYQMSKWWARRRSSVFRAMLIAAAMEAPTRKNADGSPVLDEDGIPVPDETEVSKAVWDVYYANHQKAENFKHLKVLDCFMGGGTTLVEGSRLGFQVTGVDLNPVAWFVVKNELACTDPDDVRKFFDQIEAEVKPVIQPFYVADCPRGHQGRWYKLAGTEDSADDTLMLADFDPLALAPDERKAYRYSGPEVIYTFWAKHGQCTKRRCDHRTPVFRTPVIAEKKLGVKYIALTCKNKECRTEFHAELGAARMAPGADRVVLNNDQPFTELSQPFAQRLNEYSEGKKEDKQRRVEELLELIDKEQGLCCPKCSEFSGQFVRDVLQMHNRAQRVTDYIAEHLTPDGRAGIIVPNGIVATTQNAYVSLRRFLVEDSLVAVVSLPAGVFKPYSGVKTSILFLDKKLARQSREILFLKITADGFDLGDKRNPIEANDLPEAERVVKAWISGKLSESIESSVAWKLIEKQSLLRNRTVSLQSEAMLGDSSGLSEVETVRLGDICENLDSKRKPVTKSDRNKGQYPYYGASGVVDYVDNYLFDEKLLLVSEDGANLLARSSPIAFSVSGKVWVNNHAHVLRFPEMATQRFVEYYLNSVSISNYVTGAAQPKLNQESLNSIEIPLPPLEEQRRIVAEIEGYQKEIARHEAEIVENRKRIDATINAVWNCKPE